MYCLLMTISGSSQKNGVDCDWTVYTFPNGSKASEGCLVNGKPEGIWKAYHTNGQVKSEGGRINHLLDGTWCFYDSSGVKLRTVDYVADKKTGWERTYHENGMVKLELSFNEDVEVDRTNFYNEKGQIIETIPIKNGLKEGRGKRFGSDGRTIAFLEYKAGILENVESFNELNDQGQKTGLWFFWNESDVVIEKGEWKDDVRHGLFVFYNKWGQLDRVEYYQNGLLIEEEEEKVNVDVRTTEHANGTIATRGVYVDDLREGVFTEYDEDGNIISGAVYEGGTQIAEGITNLEGKRIGIWKEFYPTGEVKVIGQYENGMKSGRWEYFAESGELIQEGSFLEGELHGNWRWYYLDGDLHRDESYRRGKENGLFQEWSESGELLVKGEYDNGWKQGFWILDVNDHREEGVYLDNERHGDWLHIYQNDIELFSGSYEMGIPTGKHIYRSIQGNLERVERWNLGQKHGKWMYYGPQQTVERVLEYKRDQLIRFNGQKVQSNEKISD